MLQEWKLHQVTKERDSAIRERIEEIKQQLLGMGNDREFDVFLKGMAKAFSEVLSEEINIQEELQLDDDPV